MSAKRKRRRHVQLTLDEARRPDGEHGGWRRWAGRKKKPGAVSHSTRAVFPARHPQHVTLRVIEGAPALGREWLMKIIRGAIRQSHKASFRVVEFNILANHAHFIAEADGKDALATGVQGLEVRLARRLNLAMKRRGKLFAHRYHARSLKTPREVRNALRYVLLNRKHHDAEKKFARYWIDPCSSAAWFTGWAEPIRTDTAERAALVAMARPTALPTVWLLTIGWHQRHGPLRFDEHPA